MCAVINSRFNRSYDFFAWADKEAPHEWQKLALINARDQIQKLKAEVEFYKTLKATMDATKDAACGRGSGNSTRNPPPSNPLPSLLPSSLLAVETRVVFKVYRRRDPRNSTVFSESRCMCGST
ncbi:unnamed protein product [Cochlearia groenlandica]